MNRIDLYTLEIYLNGMFHWIDIQFYRINIYLHRRYRVLFADTIHTISAFLQDINIIDIHNRVKSNGLQISKRHRDSVTFNLDISTNLLIQVIIVVYAGTDKKY